MLSSHGGPIASSHRTVKSSDLVPIYVLFGPQVQWEFKTIQELSERIINSFHRITNTVLYA